MTNEILFHVVIRSLGALIVAILVITLNAKATGLSDKTALASEKKVHSCATSDAACVITKEFLYCFDTDAMRGHSDAYCEIQAVELARVRGLSTADADAAVQKSLKERG